MIFLNEYDKNLMALSGDFVHNFCTMCGEKATEIHHIVPRSHGGTDGPTVSLCRKHHNDVHMYRQLHFAAGEDTEDGTQGEVCFLQTEKPMSLSDACKLDGWFKLSDPIEIFAYYWSQQ